MENIKTGLRLCPFFAKHNPSNFFSFSVGVRGMVVLITRSIAQGWYRVIVDLGSFCLPSPLFLDGFAQTWYTDGTQT